jgi:hypothetical protein
MGDEFSCRCRNRIADQAEKQAKRLTLSALKKLIDTFKFQKDGMDGQLFSPLSFPSLSLLFLYFPLFFSVSFRCCGQSSLFFSVYCYVFDPNCLPHSCELLHFSILQDSNTSVDRYITIH